MTFYDVLIFSDLRTQFLDSSYTDVHVKTQIAQIALELSEYHQKAWGTHVKWFFNALRRFGNDNLAIKHIF